MSHPRHLAGAICDGSTHRLDACLITRPVARPAGLMGGSVGRWCLCVGACLRAAPSPWIPKRPWPAEVGLIKVKEALYKMGVPVAYMQLDDWW